MRRTAAPLLLLALAVSACGATGGSEAELVGEERRVADAVEDLGEAGTERETRRICRQILAPPLAARLGSGCEARIEDALDAADSFSLEVEDVRIAGTRAFARVQSGPQEADDRRVELVRVGAAWRISSLG